MPIHGTVNDITVSTSYKLISRSVHPINILDSAIFSGRHHDTLVDLAIVLFY